MPVTYGSPGYFRRGRNGHPITACGASVTLDKLAHILAGAAIAATVALYTTPVFGSIAAVAAGAAKELYDRAGHGTPDMKDFLATALGATVVLPALLL